MHTNFPRLFESVGFLAGALLMSGSLSAQETDWVVHRRIGPPPGFTGTGYGVGVFPRALDDHDSNSYPELVSAIGLEYPGLRTEDYARVIDGAGLAVRWEAILPSPPQVAPLSTTFLASTSGMALASLSSSQKSVVFYNPSSHQVIANLPLPPPPAGYPAPFTVDDLLVAGDTDGDGFEDLYARITAIDPVSQQRYVVLGRIDGATLQYSWVRYLPSSTPPLWPPRPLFAEPWRDLDHDGYTDVVLATNDATGSTVTTLSGRDGSTLWETGRPGDEMSAWSILNDFDGDGIREIGCLTEIDWYPPPGSKTPGSVRVLDGATGTLLWDNPYGTLLPWLNVPGNQKMVYLHNICGSGDHDRDGYLDVIVDMSEFEDFLDPGYEMAWVFSGRDGAFLGRETTAQTQYPWSSDPLQGGGGRRAIGMIWTVPDIDRDGWPERLTEYSVIGSGYSLAIDLIILQRRSLRVGARLHLGSAANYELDLPACGGLSYAVLFSSEFSPWPGGLRFGPWNVALGIDPVLLASSQEPSLSGVLGPNGLAQGTFPMSSDARLLGRTLFARAVVFDAAAPGGVRTLSSLEYSTVVP